MVKSTFVVVGVAGLVVLFACLLPLLALVLVILRIDSSQTVSLISIIHTIAADNRIAELAH